MPHSGDRGGSAATVGVRFDLSGLERTCYPAEAALITLLEAWSGIAVIPRPELAARDISTVTVQRDLRLADATSNQAIRFGVTSEMFTTTDYALSQQCAQALRDAGFNGLRHCSLCLSLLLGVTRAVGGRGSVCRTVAGQPSAIRWLRRPRQSRTGRQRS
ncbi:hypothetical protein [Rhodococcus pyridinivorans]|uniref:hypothetical protein n=1 Tax=Rhodococcus pyridinivorans TaxID=103816 RepID=UPI00128EA404|nr:hypothetical protein [Rhodococcus pyridinivorans]